MFVKENLGSKFLIVSTFAAILAGTGVASAQVATDPPGAAYQDQGNREWIGGSMWGEPRQAVRPGSSGEYALYGYLPDRRAPVRHQGIVRRKHSE